MDFRDLRLVVALADELHFGRAAQRVGIGQPALSQHLRRLEGRLGVPLFERSTHAVRLTDAGQAFAREARHLLNRLGAFEDHMSSFVEQPTLRVGSIDPIYDLSVTLVAQLGRRLEGVRVTEVAVESFAEAHERMLAGDLDVYLGVRVHTDGVAGFPLRSDRFGAFLATTHPLAGRSSITVADVADEPVMLDPDNRTPEYVAVVRRVFADAGIEPRRSLSGSTSLFGAVLAIPHGGPIVVAPDVDGRPPGVTFVPFSDPTAEDSWHLMWLDPPRRELVTTAVEVVRQVVADEGWQITAGTPR